MGILNSFPSVQRLAFLPGRKLKSFELIFIDSIRPGFDLSRRFRRVVG